MPITINMNEKDFERLSGNSTSWGERWRWQWEAGRFENMSKKYDEEPRFDWAHAYWLGDSWTTVLLARSFLEAHGHEYEVLWDMNENPEPQYVILTTYVPSSWQQVTEGPSESE